MKKTIGLGLLLLTGITAFAAPAAAYERYDACNTRKVVVVERRPERPVYRAPRIQYERYRR